MRFWVEWWGREGGLFWDGCEGARGEGGGCIVGCEVVK